MTAAEILVEMSPSGLRDLPRQDPRQRTCWACNENLFVGPHAPRCTEQDVVFRSLSTDPVVRRAEDALERATRRAFKAWILAGRRP